jgi:octaprenyl-diphosphate synthase
MRGPRVCREDNRHPTACRAARELIIAAGALDATLDLAESYADRSKQSLADFAPGDWRDGLEALADFAVSRRA